METLCAKFYSKKIKSVVFAVVSFQIATFIDASDATQFVSSRPLRPPSASAGATMFTLLPPATTGIVSENRYSDPRIWAERYGEFSVGAIGTGVAIGDFDRDGRPDIFVVNKTDSCQLFRNLGDWRFEDVSAAAGIFEQGEAARVWKQGVAFVDINNDGWLDVYLCRYAAPNRLYINQTDGTFREEAAVRGLAVTDASVMASFCDYDLDGCLDVYLQTNVLDISKAPEGQHDYLFRNRGDGTFEDVTKAAGIFGFCRGHSTLWWDYDKDGYPDLYVTNDFSEPDKLYHNNHNGTFKNALDSVFPSQPYHSMGCDLGDINNDGRMDLFVGEMARTNHERDFRTIAETRTRPNEQEVDARGVPQYMRNMLFMNTGTGRFLEAAFLAGLNATDWTWAPRFEDLDNDGRVDLYVTNGMVREYDNVDLRHRTMEAESSWERVKTVQSSPVAGDKHLAFRNLGELKFENLSDEWGLGQTGVGFGAAFGDLDNDGDLDLVYSCFKDNVAVLRNDCATNHRLIIELKGTRSNRFGVGATVTLLNEGLQQQRYLTLTRGYLSTSEPAAHFGLGTSLNAEKLMIDWPSGQRQVLENIVGDRRYNITEPPELSSTEPAQPPLIVPQFVEVGERINFCLQSKESDVVEVDSKSLVGLRFNRRGPSLGVGDLNGDGLDDLVLGGTALNPLRILMKNGSMSIYNVPHYIPAQGGTLNDGPIVVFDANGDGANDVFVTKGGTTAFPFAKEFQPTLWLNDGTGSFHPASNETLPKFRGCTGAVAVADFNRDGQLDLFIGARVRIGAYPLPPHSALWLNHDGIFEDVTEAMAPGLREAGMVTSAIWTDVDDDGWLDLAVTTEWGALSCWRNLQGSGFENQTKELGFSEGKNGFWTSLTAADFNGDGRMDYVVGNIGLNTPYTADATHPAIGYYGEVEGGRSPLFIEGTWEGNRIYPTRTRRELVDRIPEIGKRFPNNNSFAQATLQQIFGEERLKNLRLFSASELRSGIFLSQENGRFIFNPLPTIAQMAPFQGLAAEDFDGDGCADLVVAQNSFAPIYSIGRFSGALGVFLKGDGKGQFMAMPTLESGIMISGDAKAAVVTDINNDEWPDLLVTRNNSTTLAFENRGNTASESFAVQLVGLAGNMEAVGARVTLHLSDDTKIVKEVYSGFGYESQSTRTLYFTTTPNRRAQKLTIRWPDGKQSEVSLNMPKGILQVFEKSQ